MVAYRCSPRQETTSKWISRLLRFRSLAVSASKIDRTSWRLTSWSSEWSLSGWSISKMCSSPSQKHCICRIMQNTRHKATFQIQVGTRGASLPRKLHWRVYQHQLHCQHSHLLLRSQDDANRHAALLASSQARTWGHWKLCVSKEEELYGGLRWYQGRSLQNPYIQDQRRTLKLNLLLHWRPQWNADNWLGRFSYPINRSPNAASIAHRKRLQDHQRKDRDPADPNLRRKRNAQHRDPSLHDPTKVLLVSNCKIPMV